MNEQEYINKIKETKELINKSQSYVRKRDLTKYLQRLERELRRYRQIRYGKIVY